MWRTIVSRVTGQFYDAVVQYRAMRPGNRGTYGILGNVYSVTYETAWGDVRSIPTSRPKRTVFPGFPQPVS
jgi:hypothetical protein